MIPGNADFATPRPAAQQDVVRARFSASPPFRWKARIQFACEDAVRLYSAFGMSA
jgi:hypothetical protein